MYKIIYIVILPFFIAVWAGLQQSTLKQNKVITIPYLIYRMQSLGKNKTLLLVWYVKLVY